MCGIVGLIDARNRADPAETEAVATRMRDCIQHRGPDDSGIWIEPDSRVALGHRRLSIIDLSPHGHQPMHSADGRYVIVFNGEIYNYLEIRRELEALGINNWRGHSDTEVMVEAIGRWGLERSLKKFIGMFAFALWDRSEKVLHLARDRLGEKPLYYGWVNSIFLFGSELKALRAHPDFNAEIDRDSLALLLRHCYIPGPYTIYRNIFKLPPAAHLAIPVARWRSRELKPIPYWSLKDAARAGMANPLPDREHGAIQQLESVLSKAIKQQMIADVPLGAFLSGGIDSSTVVALMQAQSAQPVKTFSIGFSEEEYNEAHHAKLVANHLKTDHTELYVTPRQAMEVIPKLPTLYDEPFADSSQIPTFLVSELARRHVTVSLSGDGGDELFCGYNRYFWSRDISRRAGLFPVRARRALAAALTSISPAAWDWIFGRARFFLPQRLRHGNAGDKLHKFAQVLSVDSPESVYHGLMSHWRNPESLVLRAREPVTPLTDSTQWLKLSDFKEHMMYMDAIAYLPDDILVKVDRAAMGVSLETRVPFLDYRVVEFAWRVPLSMKVRNGQGKWLLRQVLYKYVPKELVERPKMGFGVPIDSWLRGPLREWAESLLDPVRLRREEYFDPAPIQEKWQDHLSGARNWQYYLWDVLMFQAWLEHTQHDSGAKTWT